MAYGDIYVYIFPYLTLAGTYIVVYADMHSYIDWLYVSLMDLSKHYLLAYADMCSYMSAFLYLTLASTVEWPMVM